MRRVLNILQSTAISTSQVTEETVYTCVGHPLQSDISDILKLLLNDEMSATYNSILFLFLINCRFFRVNIIP